MRAHKRGGGEGTDRGFPTQKGECEIKIHLTQQRGQAGKGSCKEIDL